jgi:hypothetical protein
MKRVSLLQPPLTVRRRMRHNFHQQYSLCLPSLNFVVITFIRSNCITQSFPLLWSLQFGCFACFLSPATRSAGSNNSQPHPPPGNCSQLMTSTLHKYAYKVDLPTGQSSATDWLIQCTKPSSLAKGRETTGAIPTAEFPLIRLSWIPS